MEALYLLLMFAALGITLFTGISMLSSAASRRASKKQLLKSSPIRKVSDVELQVLVRNHFFAKYALKRNRAKAQLKSDGVFALKGKYALIRQEVNNQVTYIHTIDNVAVVLPLDAEECIHNHQDEIDLENLEEHIQSGAIETYLDENDQRQVRFFVILDAEVVVNSKKEIVVISIKNKFDLVSAAERADQFQSNEADFLQGRKGSYYDQTGQTLVYELLNQRDETPTEIKERNVITGCAAGFLYLLAAILWLIALNLSFENSVAIILLFSGGLAALIFGVIVHYRYRIMPSPMKINRLRGKFHYAFEVDTNNNRHQKKHIGELSFTVHQSLSPFFDRNYQEGDELDIELNAETREVIGFPGKISVEQLNHKFPPIILQRHVWLLVFGIIIGLMSVYAPITVSEMSQTIKQVNLSQSLNLSDDVTIEQLKQQLNQDVRFNGIGYCKGISVKPLDSHRCGEVKILLDRDPREAFSGKQAKSLDEVQDTIDQAFSGGIQLQLLNRFDNDLLIKERPTIEGIFTNPENYPYMLEYLHERFEALYQTHVSFEGQIKEIIQNPNDPINPLIVIVNVDYEKGGLTELLASIGYLLMLILTGYLLLIHGAFALIRFAKADEQKDQKKAFLKTL